jgi:inosose dehydratase
MRLAIGNAPVSWGIERADDARNPPWQVFLDELAGAGYRWTELGPFGYLPSEGTVTRDALAARGLAVIAGYVYEPLSEPSLEKHVRRQSELTCATVQALEGRYVVVIDRMNEERMATAGRSDAARRLDDARFELLIQNIESIAALAGDSGLRAVFHPHVGSYVEFEDEIEKCVQMLDSSVGLCLDTGHAAYAGLDPVALYETYAERIQYFHFKDVDEKMRTRVLTEKLGWEEAVADGIFRPLGGGLVDFSRLRDALDLGNFQGWATVEQDTEPGNYAAAQTAAEASLRFLERSGLAA